MAERSYKITATGKDARAGEDTAIPTDYRRLLALIEDQTHFNVIRGRLREYPDHLLEEWLAELEELGFIETLPRNPAPNWISPTTPVDTRAGAPRAAAGRRAPDARRGSGGKRARAQRPVPRPRAHREPAPGDAHPRADDGADRRGRSRPARARRPARQHGGLPGAGRAQRRRAAGRAAHAAAAGHRAAGRDAARRRRLRHPGQDPQPPQPRHAAGGDADCQDGERGHPPRSRARRRRLRHQALQQERPGRTRSGRCCARASACRC